VLGVLEGNAQLLASKAEGESSSWRRINLDEIDITTLKITEEEFDKPKTFPPNKENLWDKKIYETYYGVRRYQH
jgi:hypothetical protein